VGVAAWTTLLVVVGVCVAIVVVPALLLRPFSPQGPSAVSWSYALRQHSPWITTAGAVIVVALVVRTWRRARWIARSALVLATILSLAVPLRGVSASDEIECNHLVSNHPRYDDRCAPTLVHLVMQPRAAGYEMHRLHTVP